MKKDLLLQIMAGLAAVILGIAAMVYGIRFLQDETKGNIPTCIILILCCMAEVLVCLLIRKHNMKKYKK